MESIPNLENEAAKLNDYLICSCIKKKKPQESEIEIKP